VPEGKSRPWVKNLESVQGDERDVIFAGITYGKDANGTSDKIRKNLGPITKAQGPRRLNVLFTRARKRFVVFSSFRAPELNVADKDSAGLRDLRDYLEFAETGVLRTARLSRRAPDSDFEVTVAEALGRRGFRVEPQVGVAGYFIDLAVRHPEHDGIFVLGVECDGATYHSSYSARDRDRLREQVLIKMGWRIHRIWSTAWFSDPNKETHKLVEAVNAAVRDGVGRVVRPLPDDRRRPFDAP
jgi:very-short-patch-repair endonuclease